MQQNTPEQRPDAPVPDAGQSAPVRGLYTGEEWRALLETPVTLCRAIIAVAPSGAPGTSQEVVAMRASLNEVLQQASSPLLQSQEKVETLWRDIQQFFKDRQDAGGIRQTAIAACGRCVSLLQNVPARDGQAYKEFVYAVACRVAQAAREGGLAISDAEQALLREVAGALGLPRA